MLFVVIFAFYSCSNRSKKNAQINNLELIVNYKEHSQDSNQIKLIHNKKTIYNWVTNDNLYLGNILIYDKFYDTAYFNNPAQLNDSVIIINSIFIGNAYLSIIINDNRSKYIESDYTFMLYLKDKNSIVYFPHSKSDYFEDEDQIAPLNIYNLSTKDTIQVQLPFHYISKFNNMCESDKFNKEVLNDLIKYIYR